ncbi:MAG: corrinoid protein [Firmicutes bacterium]|nr:corrinoid protein [Bacillota bacterium]
MTCAAVERVAKALEELDIENARSIVEQAVADGVPPAAILEEGLIAGMSRIGEKFRNNEVFLPEVIVAASIWSDAMKSLSPFLASEATLSRGKVVIGTVKGDIHDIGKNLVKAMLEGEGFSVVDLGVDVTPERFRDAVVEHKPDVLAISALLTTTQAEIPVTIRYLEREGVRRNVKIIVGGAPITHSWALSTGADGWAPDARTAVDAVRALLGKP